MSLDDFYGSQHDEDETDDEETNVDEAKAQKQLRSKKLKVFMVLGGMMHVPWRCLDSICHAVASANQEAIWTM